MQHFVSVSVRRDKNNGNAVQRNSLLMQQTALFYNKGVYVQCDISYKNIVTCS